MKNNGKNESINYACWKLYSQTGKIVQCDKALVTKPDDLSWIPGTQVAEEEKEPHHSSHAETGGNTCQNFISKVL